jgi:hypothetical protein
MSKLGRIFLLSVLFGLVSCAGSDGFRSGTSLAVKVTGVGSTIAEARKSGLRDAIQQAYGTLVLSERRVLNDKLFEDDISYARGVIDRFEVESSHLDPNDNLYRISMMVTVSPSLIEKRFLDSQDATQINGDVLGKQIAMGRVQAESEADRYMQARKLFEHVSKEIGRSIFDVSLGKVETVREGSEITTYINVDVSINAKSLKSLCASAREYQLTRLKAVPEQYRSGLRSLRISHAYNCSEDVQVESDHFQSILTSLKGVGICLNFKDKSGNTFERKFYGDIKLIDDGMTTGNESVPSYAQGWVCGHGSSCAYEPRKIGVSTFSSRDLWSNHSPDVIRIGRLAWGNEIPFILKLPEFDQGTVFRISEINAKITTADNCN